MCITPRPLPILPTQQIGPGDHVDFLDENGCTPLMYAAIADSWPAAEMLLNFSAKREMVKNHTPIT